MNLGLPKMKQLVPFNPEWLISTVAQYRIPRISFIFPEASQPTEEIDESCCFIQDFNRQADGILRNYDYEYIEVFKI